MADDVYIVDQLATGTATIYLTDDGSGFDTIQVMGGYAEYSAITLEWTVDLGQPTSASGLYWNVSGGHRLVISGQIEAVLGSQTADYITGNILDNQLIGDGDAATGGNDTIYGGAGNDLLEGRIGLDHLDGGAGNDTILGGTGNDTISGGDGLDTVEGGAGADSMSGGSNLGDWVSYSLSTAKVQLDITFGAGTTGHGGDAEGDTVYGFSNVTGSDYSDKIVDTVKGAVAFSGNANHFRGLAGNDDLWGGGGDDTLEGNTGHDRLVGEDGNDYLGYVSAGQADDGTDRLYGGNGQDTLNGGVDNDILFGGDGRDTLLGGSGNDILHGGAGADRLTGNLGADRFEFLQSGELMGAAPFDTITDFKRAQGDWINLAGIDAKAGEAGNQAFTFIGSAAFSKVEGELRAVTSGANMKILGDLDGDGKADFAIILLNASSVRASDFDL